jgi:hypothetical protein
MAEAEPIKYWLSTCPPDISIKRLADIAKMRQRIEHDYISSSGSSGCPTTNAAAGLVSIIMQRYALPLTAFLPRSV